jgi:hypothetical protein
MLAVGKQVTNKLAKGTISTIALKTAAKIAIAQIVNGSTGTAASGIANGLINSESK